MKIVKFNQESFHIILQAGQNLTQFKQINMVQSIKRPFQPPWYIFYKYSNIKSNIEVGLFYLITLLDSSNNLFDRSRLGTTRLLKQYNDQITSPIFPAWL